MKNKICVVTGAGGLVGSEAVRYFAPKFYKVIGIDNDMRGEFFGTSVKDNIKELKDTYGNYYHYHADVSEIDYIKGINNIIYQYCDKIDLVIHCAAQPSHDWAAQDPIKDFQVNALGTLNMLNLCRTNCPNAVFIHMSTNKVYGDAPNFYETDYIHMWKEQEKRYEIIEYDGEPIEGFIETMSIDNSTHSLFGCSKASADLYAQEYARYYGLKTGIFRAGCITGEHHKGAEQHGFLSYLVKCAVENSLYQKNVPYNIYGTGKQVRDNIHAHDLVRAFDEFYKNPKPGEVYNIGGGRGNDVSVLEAIDMVNDLLFEDGFKSFTNYTVHPDQWRKGDHKWYITNLSKFKEHYPDWTIKISLENIIRRIYNSYKPKEYGKDKNPIENI